MSLKYELPAPNKCGDEWRLYQAPGFQPTPRQQLVMEATARAIDAGLEYNVQVCEAVAADLGVTPEQLSRNTHRVAGGDFAYDVYYARGAVEAQRFHQQLRDTAASLALKAGEKLGTLIFNDGKRMTGAILHESGTDGRDFLIQAKRGAKPTAFRCNVSALTRAIQTAHERQARPDSYDDFRLARLRLSASPLVAQVAKRLANTTADHGPAEISILEALGKPEGMSQPVFLQLQGLMESLESAVAMGQDCLAGFDAMQEEVERLMDASPWTMHPDHGCVLAADVEELDRATAPAPH